MLKSRHLNMRIFFFLMLLSLFFFPTVNADVAPVKRVTQGICSSIKDSYIRMDSEKVFIDLTTLPEPTVSCTFELVNLGDSVTIDIGFPEMHFQVDEDDSYFEVRELYRRNLNYFYITVNEKKISSESICFSNDLNKFFSMREEEKQIADSIRYIQDLIRIDKDNGDLKRISTAMANEFSVKSDNSLSYLRTTSEGYLPWYVWREHFEQNEKKTICVNYTMPFGVERNYNSLTPYFKYILSSGAGWFYTIGEVYVEMKYKGRFDDNRIGLISPGNYSHDKDNGVITWFFYDFEPTDKDNIYIQLKPSIINVK